MECLPGFLCLGMSRKGGGVSDRGNVGQKTNFADVGKIWNSGEQYT